MKDNRVQNLKIESGKDLLRQCVKKMKEDQRGEVGNSKALYPVVIVFMGERCKQHARDVKSTLDDNFDNARFLQYISIDVNGDECQCSVLDDVESENYDELKWRTVEGDFQNAVDAAVKLMRSDGVFGDKNSVKIEYIIDAQDEASKKYFDLYLNTGSTYNITVLSTMYMMIDQTADDGSVYRSEEFMRLVVDHYKEEPKGTIYLISNELFSGDSLNESRIWRNYRLVANIIMLGNSGNDQGDAVYNGIKEVSYTLITKDSEKISTISLYTMLEEMKARHEEEASKQLTNEAINKELGIDINGSIEMASRWFEKISVNYPKYQNMQYLPFRSEQDYNAMLKSDKISIEKANSYTYGAAETYINMHYIEPVENYFQNQENVEECRRAIRELIQKKFLPKQLADLAHKSEQIVEEWRGDELSFSGFGAGKDVFQKLHLLAVYEGEKRFTSYVKGILIEEFLRATETSKVYFTIYNDIMSEVRKEAGAICYGVKFEQDLPAYKEYVKSFVHQHATDRNPLTMTSKAYDEAFVISDDKNEILSGLWNAFLDLMRCEQFTSDFEGDIDFQMDFANDIGKQKLIQNFMNSDPVKDICLSLSLQVARLQKGCYFLLNKRAGYYRMFEEKQRKDGNFSMFDLNRTDSIERITFYDITNPEILHLYKQK